MTYTSSPLPYETDALEPYISKQIIDSHYGVRTKKYFETASKLAEGTVYANQKLQTVLTKDSLSKVDSKFFIQASQAWSHEFYWESMAPKSQTGDISDELSSLIEECFGSKVKMIAEFTEVANSIVGSGWTWLLLRNNTLTIKNIPNAGSPLSTEGSIPLLVCDGWEHSFELQYPAARDTYLTSFFQVVNWTKVNERFAHAKK